MGRSTANERFQRVVRAASAHGTYTKSVAVGAALFQKPSPGAQEWSTNLLGACADRASITMEGAVCAKQRHGTTASDLGHQQFAPTKITFGHLA
jgi:hypothetical protein